MKVCIAIDSFKGSLSTIEAGEAVMRGVQAVYPDASVSVVPLADGGEGTVDAIISAAGGRLVTATVTGPLGKSVRAIYGILPDEKTAVIEIASAAGLTLVPAKSRNPLYTTTWRRRAYSSRHRRRLPQIYNRTRRKRDKRRRSRYACGARCGAS